MSEPFTMVDRRGPALHEPADLARSLALVAADLGSRYEMLGYLGRGAFATVWKGRDRFTGDAVAIKRFESRSGPSSGFYRELSALFRLNHPRIVRIFNLLEKPAGQRYLILEHCDGGSLRDRLQGDLSDASRLELSAVLEITRQIAEGLAEAHRLGLAHRDLKPENVLFEKAKDRAAVKLADFGLARALQRVTTVAPSGALTGLSGTPAYMAPEQFNGRFDAATDLYALGVILFELLHGRVPFQGAPEQIAYHHLQSVPEVSSTLPRAWQELLRTLLDKDHRRRPSAPDLAAALAKLPTDEPIARRANGSSLDRYLPTSTFALFAENAASETGFVAVSAEALFHLDLQGRLCGDPIPVDSVTGAEQAADGTLWLIHGDRLSRIDPSQPGTEVLRTADPIAAVAPQSRGRVAVVTAGQLGEWVVSEGRFKLCWKVPLRMNGLPPALARLSDGRLAYGEGPSHSCVKVLDPAGNLERRVPLPGPCWELRPWPTTSRLLVTLLVGNGLQTHVIDANTGTVTALEGTGPLDLVTAGLDGMIHGLRLQRDLVRWQPSGQTCGRALVAANGATPRALAVAGRHVAILERTPDGCRVNIVVPFDGDDGHGRAAQSTR